MFSLSQIGESSLRLNKARACRSIMSNGSWSGLERGEGVDFGSSDEVEEIGGLRNLKNIF